MRRLFVTIVGVLFILLPTKAQREYFYLTSQVKDNFTNLAIEDVNAYLLSKDSLVLDSTNTTNTGSFSFKIKRELKLKSCIIKLTHPKYQTEYITQSLRHVGKTQYFKLPELFITRKNTLTNRTMDEVMVTATKVKMYYKGDTLVYNADAFNVANGSMLDDLIRQLPNTEMNKDGEIFVNGRKVENLLLNGKDFFKGNHRLMLENLPYYTVKNIKVYEQTSEKALALGDERAHKDYVMDVILKKEYSKGYMVSVDGGGGTESAYLARLFGLRFSNASRFAVVGGANNLNMSDYSFNGNYHNYSNRDGRTDNQLLAAELLTDTKRNKNVLTLKLNRKKPKHGADVFEEVYHSDASTFITRQNSAIGRTLGATISNSYTLKMPFWLESITKLNINNSKEISEDRYYESGADTRQRGIDVLDSLFDMGVAINDHSLIAARKRIQKEKANTYGVSQDFVFAENLFSQDIIDISAGVDYNQHDRTTERFDNYMIWKPSSINSNITESIVRPNSHIGAKADFSYKSSRLLYNTDLKFYANYRFNRDKEGEKRTDVASSVLDAQNSYNQEITENRYVAGVNYHYDLMKSDRKIRTEVRLDMPVSVIDRRTNYTRHTVDTCLVQQPVFFEPSLTISHSKWRGYIPTNTIWALKLSSSLKQDLVDATQLISLPLMADRMTIYQGNPDLKSPIAWNSQFHWKYKSISMDINYNLYFNRVVNSYAYDSGVYTYKPMNVDGTWNLGINTKGSHHINIPKLNQAINFLNWKVEGTFRNMKNYTLDGATGTSTLINNDELYINVPIDFGGRIKNLDYTITTGLGWRKPIGNISNIDYQDALEYWATLWLTTPVVAGIHLDTEINFVKRYGYANEELNRLSCQWDATLSKSLWKERIELRVAAIDLLRQHRSIAYVMNEQGIRETHSITLPSYFLFTVAYRFNKEPQKK